MRAGLAAWAAISAAVAAGAGGELLRLGWDGLIPGTEVRGLGEKPARGSPEREARVYVGNVHRVSEPNALMYDFQDIPPQEPRGYAAVDLPDAGDGWSELQICFLREQGNADGEIRGFYRCRGQGKYGVQLPWAFINLKFGGVFTVNVAGQPKEKTVRVGEVLPRIWHRATVRIPPPGTEKAVGLAKLERRRGDGSFAPAGEAEIPFGSLVLKEVKFFDLWGRGPCRLAFDDLVWGSVGSGCRLSFPEPRLHQHASTGVDFAGMKFSQNK